VNEAGKLPVEPFLQGEPAGQGIWSPGGDHLFLPLLEIPIPGSDRRSTSLHFISANSGEDCPATETFLGSQGSQQNYAWLDDERVLFIDRQGRALLFTLCQPGSEDLRARFDEPLLRVAQPLDLSQPAPQGPLLLEAPSAYWLLDRATLEARPLAEPVPSSDLDPAVLQTRTQADPIPTLDLADSFAWSPSGSQVAVLQPVPGRPGLSRLVLLDLESGLVTRSLEIEAGNEGRAPFAEWLGPERLMVWSMDAAGPLLVDLSEDQPRQVRVMTELFGLDLVYPDEMYSIGSFYDPAGGSYHIVAHVNLREDRSIYLYHGESGQVEQLDGDRQVLMIFPSDQRMPLAALQDVPNYDDSYDLVWVDASDRAQGRLQVAGHTPRGYPNLQSRLLPGSSSILFGSTQGISLVGLPGGETLVFWRLVGAETSTLPSMSVAPDGRSLLVTAHLESSAEGKNQGALLYWIGLDAPGQEASP
jgi:hypothetical protein